MLTFRDQAWDVVEKNHLGLCAVREEKRGEKVAGTQTD